MGRLSVRLVVSHVAVALVGGVVTALLARLLAPALYAEMQRRAGRMAGRGMEAANAAMRQQWGDSVDQALLVGSLVGVLVAGVIGVLIARRFLVPIRQVSHATRSLARGDYAVAVPVPSDRELAQLATDVQTLGSTLAETEQRRVRLLGEVAHELRTPLTVIDGYVEGMMDGVLPVTPEALGHVSEEVRRLRRLSDDLSALSRAQEGRLALAPRLLDLRETVRTAAERLRPQAEDAGLTLAVTVADAEVRANADPDRVAQVVTNLIGNAIRATPPGGRVDVAVRGEGPDAVVTVADTGEGLAAADLERVFERFYRVPGRREDGHDTGSGIGLTIARQIMRAQGGDLVAVSRGPGAGATFVGSLPRA